MALSARRSSALARKIASLQLNLTPLVPLTGDMQPHPDFPKTIMHLHLLTEEQMDSIAHFYHQSTPGPYTLCYPATMNWDKDFLRKRTTAGPSNGTSEANGSQQVDQGWLNDLVAVISGVRQQGQIKTPSTSAVGTDSVNRYAALSDIERMAIKRRKIAKFIGIPGNETPAEEIAGRLQMCLERAIQLSRKQLRRDEEHMMGWRKLA